MYLYQEIMNKGGEMKRLTEDRLKEVLDYDTDTGIFIWKERVKSDDAWLSWGGKVAGCTRHDGYISIRVDDKQYLAHRLAWLYTHGYLPENDIDHINGNTGDNRISNLREVSHACNMQNQKIRSTNKSGITGVSWDKRRKKWHVNISINNKQTYTGRFNNKLDAAKARYAAEQKHHNCIVKSSAKKYIDAAN